MKEKSMQKKLLEEIASVGQDDGVEALTEERIGEIRKKYNISETEFADLETEIFSAGNVTSLSDNEETLENVAGGKLDIKKGTATLLAALNVAGPFASSAFATGAKEGSPKIDTIKTRTQTPTNIKSKNSEKHNNSSKERIAKMYENTIKYVQEKFGLTREKAKSIVSADYVSQKYQSAIKYVQENFGLSRGQAESVVAAMGVTGFLATTLFIHQVYKALTPKKPQTDSNSFNSDVVKSTGLTISEEAKTILKDCRVKEIPATEPIFVFKINDDELSNIMNHKDSMVDEGKSLYVIIHPIVNFNQDIKIVSKIDNPYLYHFVLSTEEAKKLFSVDEIKAETTISDSVAKSLSCFINSNMLNNASKKVEVKKDEEPKVEEEKKDEGNNGAADPLLTDDDQFGDLSEGTAAEGGGADTMVGTGDAKPEEKEEEGNNNDDDDDNSRSREEEESEEETAVEEPKVEEEGEEGDDDQFGDLSKETAPPPAAAGGETAAADASSAKATATETSERPGILKMTENKSAKDMTDDELFNVLKRCIKRPFNATDNIEINIKVGETEELKTTISPFPNTKVVIENMGYVNPRFVFEEEQDIAIFGLESIEAGKEVDQDIAERIRGVLSKKREALNDFFQEKGKKLGKK